MRSAQSGIEQAAAQKSARAAEASRLQQQAEVERRVELFAHRHKEQQRSAQLQPPQPMAHQASEELSGSEDDWNIFSAWIIRRFAWVPGGGLVMKRHVGAH